MNVNFINKSQSVNLVDEGDIPKTKNFGIELMEPNERANYLNKWNDAMNNIDENMGLLQAVGSSSVLKIANLETRIGKNETCITELQNAGSSTSLKVDNLYQTVGSISTLLADTVGSVSTLKNTVNKNKTDIDSLSNEINDLSEHYSVINETVGTHTEEINEITTKQNLDSLKITNNYGNYGDAYTPQQNNSNGAISKKVDGMITDIENLTELAEPEKIEALQAQVTTNTSNISNHWGTSGQDWSYANPTNHGIARRINFVDMNYGSCFIVNSVGFNVNTDQMKNSRGDTLDLLMFIGSLINSRNNQAIAPATFCVPFSGASYTYDIDGYPIHVQYNESSVLFSVAPIGGVVPHMCGICFGLYGTNNNKTIPFKSI